MHHSHMYSSPPTDYISGGELFTHLYQRDSFPEDAVRVYAGELILALESLHKVCLFYSVYSIVPLSFDTLFLFSIQIHSEVLFIVILNWRIFCSIPRDTLCWLTLAFVSSFYLMKR